jgi:hypothetical protein
MRQPFRQAAAQKFDGCRLVAGRSIGGFNLKGHGTHLRGQAQSGVNLYSIPYSGTVTKQSLFPKQSGSGFIRLQQQDKRHGSSGSARPFSSGNGFFYE